MMLVTATEEKITWLVENNIVFAYHDMMCNPSTFMPLYGIQLINEKDIVMYVLRWSE